MSWCMLYKKHERMKWVYIFRLMLCTRQNNQPTLMFKWFAMLWIVTASSFLVCFPKTIVRILFRITIKTLPKFMYNGGLIIWAWIAFYKVWWSCIRKGIVPLVNKYIDQFLPQGHQWIFISSQVLSPLELCLIVTTHYFHLLGHQHHKFHHSQLNFLTSQTSITSCFNIVLLQQ